MEDRPEKKGRRMKGSVTGKRFRGKEAELIVKDEIGKAFSEQK